MKRPTITDYRTARAFLDGGRDPSTRIIGANTYVHEHGGDISIRYYRTDIVTYTPDGRIIINTGGWHSTFTSKRINTYQNEIYIYQKKYRMYFCGPQGRRSSDDPEFGTMLTIERDGSVSADL